MDSVHFIKDYRYLSDHFNREEYPMLFERVKADLEAYLTELEQSFLSNDIESILDEVEANSNRRRFKFQRESAMTGDHMVLSLFIVPAAVKIGTPLALRFAELLTGGWESRFPGSTFKIGNYEDIMEGFKWKLTLTSRKR